MNDAADAIRVLGQKLYPHLTAQPGNVVYSPYSIAVALAMALNGARDRTADELRQLLAVEDLTELNEALGSLTRRLEGLDDVTVRGACSLWGQAGSTWKPEFVGALSKGYGAALQTVDFATATEDARLAINSWVSERTKDRIPELVAEGVLNELTRLVLVNAVYLKAPWDSPFAYTQPAPFTLADGSAADVPMMGGSSEHYDWHQGEGWEAVRLRYQGGDLAMTVVLPAAGAAQSSPDLKQLLDWKPDESVVLRLPQWKFRRGESLAEPLASLGMPTAFSETEADFGGITDDEELHIGAVLHEAFVAVDEAGTEAAAATAVAMQGRGMPQQRKMVTVDRPFVFVIHDNKDLTPLFVGRVEDPRA